MPASRSRCSMASRLSSALASMSLMAEHCSTRCCSAGLAATASLTRSSSVRAFAKYRLSSTRRLTRRGLVRTSWRSTFLKCSVPGTSPTVAMCGRLVRNTYSASETPTPTTSPVSTPSANVASSVDATAAKSGFE